jgi:hypothetical protein
MLLVILGCLVLIAATTLVHYEVLRLLNERLPALGIPRRTKLLVVIFSALAAHAAEIVLYGLACYGLGQYFGGGTLTGPGGFFAGQLPVFFPRKPTRRWALAT